MKIFSGWWRRDSLAVDLARQDLERGASKRYKGFVVRTRLKRVSNEAVRYNALMREEGFSIGTSSSSSPRMGTRYGRIQAHFRDRFARCPDLPVQQFRSLGEAEAASCEGLVTECEVRDALKQVSLNKSPGLDGLPYEVYLRMSHMFVPILTDMFNLKDDTEAALINLDQSKAFDRVDYRFLTTVLETAGFQPEFRKWNSMLYHNLQTLVQVNGKRSEAFAIE